MGFLIDAATLRLRSFKGSETCALQNLAEIIVHTYYSAAAMQGCR